jgi:hypothetical protein
MKFLRMTLMSLEAEFNISKRIWELNISKRIWEHARSSCTMSKKGEYFGRKQQRLLI